MIRCKDITDYDYLVECVLSHEFTKYTSKEIAKGFKESFLFGYEVYKDDVRQGVAYSLSKDGFYTLDGYNRGDSGIATLIGARKVINRLFNDYTKEIWSFHTIKDIKSTKLLEALRFKKICVLDDDIYFKLIK